MVSTWQSKVRSCAVEYRAEKGRGQAIVAEARKAATRKKRRPAPNPPAKKRRPAPTPAKKRRAAPKPPRKRDAKGRFVKK